MKHAQSADGTTIAFEKKGKGPALILVGSAFAQRAMDSEITRLAAYFPLAQSFTVFNYDRRGRGDSTDTQPYAVEREIEDIEALIDDAGGSAFLFGSSSGAALALEAANKLSTKVKKQVLYEPPFIVDEGRAPVPADLLERIKAALVQGKRNDALKLFFSTAMGIPGFFVFIMRLMPSWSQSKAVAHTLPYDLTIMGDTQQ